MDIIFYNTSDDKRVLDKTLTDAVTLQCKLYDECNIISPKLLIEYTTTIFSKNYCYIPTFGRYYFVNNIRSDAGERLIIECSIDVLNTYKSSIKTLDVTVTRNEFADNSMLIDPLMTFCAQRHVEVYPFTNTPFNIRSAGSDKYNFVLVVGGGYGS